MLVSQRLAETWWPDETAVGQRIAFLVVQSSGDPTLVADRLRAVVASLDSETPVSRIRAVDDVMRQAVSRPRFTTTFVLGFAALGVVLGMLGVYGVVAYTAARQQRYTGIRLALGATRKNVRARFVRQALVRRRWDRHRGGRGRCPDVVAVFTAVRRRSVGSTYVRGSTGPVRRAYRGRRVASGSSRNDA